MPPVKAISGLRVQQPGHGVLAGGEEADRDDRAERRAEGGDARRRGPRRARWPTTPATEVRITEARRATEVAAAAGTRPEGDGPSEAAGTLRSLEAVASTPKPRRCEMGLNGAVNVLRPDARTRAAAATGRRRRAAPAPRQTNQIAAKPDRDEGERRPP